MQKKLRYSLTIISLAVSFAPPVAAEVPLKINFQGHLEESGAAVDGSRNMVFKIYDSASGGTLLWTSQTTSAQVSKGLFSVTLQTGTPSNLSTATFSGAGYVEVSVDGVTLLPRQEIISAPYSMVARTLADNGCSSNQILKWNASSGWICSDVSASSISSGDYLNDVKVSSAIYATAAAGVSGNINPSQVNAGALPGTVYVSSISAGNYLNDVKVSSAIYATTAAGVSGNINPSQVNAGALPGTVYVSSVSAGNYLNDVKVSSAVYSENAETKLPKTGGTMTGQLTITGSSSYIITQSSVIAPGFFGDGSGLTNISTNSLSGTIQVNQGGTGASTLTGVLKGNGTSAFTPLTGSAGKITRWSNSDTIAASGILSDDGVRFGVSGPIDAAGGVTASSGTFTAAGNGQYSIETSSGILVKAGDISLTGGKIGIRTAAPNSALHVNGPLATSVTAVSSDYTITGNDSVVTVDAGTAINITLPSAAGVSGREYKIKSLTTSTNLTTILPNGLEKIDGDVNFELSAGEAVVVVSDGSDWLILGYYHVP